jgi:hypothetical protein
MKIVSLSEISQTVNEPSLQTPRPAAIVVTASEKRGNRAIIRSLLTV